MGKKDKGLCRDPVSQHRKDEKKLQAKKMKKERTERKEARFNENPLTLQLEIDRLSNRAELLQAGGSTAKTQAKIEELIAVKVEAERRRAADAEANGDDAAPAQPEILLDMSAITGVKRKKPARESLPSQDAAAASGKTSRQEAAAGKKSAEAAAAGSSDFAPPYAPTAASAATTATHDSRHPSRTAAVAAAAAAAAETAAAAAATASAAASAAYAAASGLPEGWRPAKAPDGRTYYYHAATKATRWTFPVAAPSGTGPGDVSTALPAGWKEAKVNLLYLM